ncbi:MAG: hypothetical protein K2X31_06230 [Sphingopyxis sp.]|nr:hypothetical protein [Sphingopyxis sp.]
MIRPLSHQLWHQPDQRRAATLSAQFDGSGLAEQPLLLMIPAHSGEVAVTINGQRLERLPGEPHSSISRYHTLSLYTVPDGLVGASENRLMVERRGVMRFLAVPDVLIGPKPAIDRLAAQQRYLLSWVDNATLIAMALGVVVSLLLLFLSRRIAHYFYLMLTFALLLLLEFRDHVSLWGHPLVSYIHYFGLTYLLLSALSFSHWTEGDRRERRVIWSAFGTIAILNIGTDWAWGLHSEATTGFRSAIFLIPSAMLLAWVLFRLVRRVRQVQLAGTLVFACLAAFSSAFGVAMITLWGGPVSVEQRLWLVCFTNSAEVTAFIGLFCAAGTHEVMRYRSTLQQRGKLDLIASGTLLELDEDIERLKREIEGQAIRDERQRFTRDMHDGIGGQLLSLLLKARTGTLDPERLEREIARCISDLRLITAALEAGHDSLNGAVATFRARTEEQLKLAGMSLDWSCEGDLDALNASPHVALELLRILQELVTNAIVHSGTRTLAISINRTSVADEDMLAVRVTDFGTDFMPERAHISGRGLANMQARARRLGGTVTIARSASGGADIAVAIALDKMGMTG